MPEKIVVIGFGSLNGSDEIGWQVIDELAKQDLLAHVVPFKSKSDGTDWFPFVADATKVIFIDAVKSANTIEKVHILDNLSDCKKILSSSSHTISIIESIELAKTLNYLTVPFVFYGIETNGNQWQHLVNGMVQEIMLKLASGNRELY